MLLYKNIRMKIPKIASRTSPFQESIIREMTRLGDETESVNLSQGLPDFDPPGEVIEAAIKAIQSGNNQYTFPFGMLAFRNSIAKKTLQYNHIPANPETDVTVTCGVSEAIMATILALTDTGDEVIIIEPWYENYVPDCLMAGTKPRFIKLHEPGYTFDPVELSKAFNNHTRLILINTPHNPTGRVFKYEELNIIAKLCLEFNVIAVTDEIYEHILYDGQKHISIGSFDEMRNRTVTISGLGKSYSVTGWRVGWIVAALPLTAAIRKAHDYLTVCAPAPFQTAGIVALKLPEKYYKKMQIQYTYLRDILLSALDSAKIQYYKPEGAYYVMADFKNIEWDPAVFIQGDWTLDRAFAEYMARQIGVAVVPGSSFYSGNNQGSKRIRFNFAKQESTMKEAAKRLKKLRSKVD